MANITKGSKRGGELPRVTGAMVYTGQRYAEVPKEDGKMPPLMYCATVSGNSGYTLQLTEDEMIAVTGEWLTMMNRRRIDAAEKARREKENAARRHPPVFENTAG